MSTAANDSKERGVFTCSPFCKGQLIVQLTFLTIGYYTAVTATQGPDQVSSLCLSSLHTCLSGTKLIECVVMLCLPLDVPSEELELRRSPCIFRVPNVKSRSNFELCFLPG